MCIYNSNDFNLITKTGQSYIWDKNEGERGSNEIGTKIDHYLEQFHSEEVVMFSDTCEGQNHNPYIAVLLPYIVQNHSTIKSINYIFMVQGQSHIEVDSMHSATERMSGESIFYVQYYAGYQKVIVFTNKKSNKNHTLGAETTYQRKGTKE